MLFSDLLLYVTDSIYLCLSQVVLDKDLLFVRERLFSCLIAYTSYALPQNLLTE